MRRISLLLLIAVLFAFSGCAVNTEDNSQAGSNTTAPTQSTTGTDTENKQEGSEMKTEYEIREGVSVTAKPSSDIPAEYYVDSLSYSDMNRKLPLPNGNETVLNTAPDTTKIQALYLWEERNAPHTTQFTSNMTGYYDEYDFRPYATAIPVPDGTEIKGSVVLMAGGAYSIRANYTDTLPTALQLRELGYQCFIVDYRLRPYTQEEGALDVARAVRYIRKNADAYGIDTNDIAVMGYSAGGIQAGEFLISADENASPAELDARYVPDELDAITAHVSADAMIYSFYGRLSAASTDKESLISADLPPTFYCYGTEDPFYRQFEAQVKLMDKIGIPTKTIVLDDWPHGFGGSGGWVETYAEWLKAVFSEN